MSTNPTPEQDQQNTQLDRIGIIVLALAAMAFVFTLILMGRATSEFTGWLVLFIPVIAGMLFVHKGVRQVVAQTNGQFTDRLQKQTEDVLNGVSSVLEKGVRPESELTPAYVPERAADDASE